jgi:hypothetical protein
MDVCVVCCRVKTKEQTRTIKTKKQVRKKYEERTEELQEKENSDRGKRFFAALKPSRPAVIPLCLLVFNGYWNSFHW